MLVTSLLSFSRFSRTLDFFIFITATSNCDNFDTLRQLLSHPNRENTFTWIQLYCFSWVFFPFYLNSFAFLNIAPRGDTVMAGSPSTLCYPNRRRCKRCTQVRNTWGLTQYFFWKPIFRTCRKALLPLADVSNCIDLELGTTRDLMFKCTQTSVNQWLPSTEQEILAGGTSL